MPQIKTISKLLRTSQYIKNILIFAPVFFAAKIFDTSLLIKSFMAFAGFSLCASSIYIFNDYKDIENDRNHPVKKTRPLASGEISVKSALFFMPILLISGLAIIYLVSFKSFCIALFYIALNLFYSLWLKHISIIDITIISLGFVLRLFIGSFAVDIELSMWIIIMTYLLAIFMALAKRRDDVLFFLKTGEKTRKTVDGYNLIFLDGSMMIMSAVIIVSYILYSTSAEVIAKVGSHDLYYSVFFVLLGIMRYLQITFVEEKTGSPTNILLQDSFLKLTIAGWVFVFIIILYD